MATLLLTAAGTAVAGPVGGAIGAMIGPQADSALFAPKPRHGPRLTELALQTSSYGTQIPKIFGTMRVAGTVIWATDLREHRSSSSSGKGRPRTHDYSYSASFAVALSGRAVKSVGRIWAEGKLLRGAAGDFKSRTSYRLYTGAEDQPVDPLIASIEGAGAASAFRGIAYALFEDFALADYGNRIPSLTFELVADEAPITIGAIAQELSGNEVEDGGTLLLSGYAASGDSVRSAIEALSDLVPLSLAEDGGRLRLAARPSGPPVLIAQAQCGAHSGPSGGRTEILRRASHSVAGEVSIAYHDVGRDYQTGMQRATLGGPALRSDRRALPAAIDSSAAKAIAEYRLASLRAGRATARVHLGWSAAALRPGAELRLEGQAGLWKIARWTLEAMVTSVQLVGLPSTGPLEAFATAGRPIGSVDEPAGPTTLLLFDLPSLSDSLADRPRLLGLAASSAPGWRRAPLDISYDGGASWSDGGATAAPATLGTALSALGEGSAALLDCRASVEVALLNEAMWLEGRDDRALASGANLAVLGEELIQFGRADPLGAGRFRLSRLLRGRRGTEWAAPLHRIGEPFALIEPENVAVLEPPLAMIGGRAMVIAQGIGDPAEGARFERPIRGAAMCPPSPVHLTARRIGQDIAIRWVRRSRIGWAWLSGSDTPLGEETELYEVRILAAGANRTVTTGQPHYVYSASDQAPDGATGAVTIEVVQIGTGGSSRPARITL